MVSSLAVVLFATGAVDDADCSQTSVGLRPINDLGTASYLGAQGGLYPGGANAIPPAHLSAGQQLADRVEPLGPSGQPDPGGRIVLLSIGISNASQEFQRFSHLAASDPLRRSAVLPVNGAQGGATARMWADPTHQAWDLVDERLSAAGVTRAQVQVVWLKATNQGSGEWPRWTEVLKRDLGNVARILRDRFPNLLLVYLSSRAYGGYSTAPLSPEPAAYQSGFAVKWLIQDQISGDPQLNFDPSAGPVEAPWLAWGPYLWADGLRPRSDGLIWVCSDFEADGTHASAAGEEKVAEFLLSFLHDDFTARSWYLPDIDPTGSANLSLAIDDAPDPADPGSRVTYTLTVRNAGRGEATSVAVKASVPSGTKVVATDGGQYDGTAAEVTWQIAELEAGQASSRKLVVQLSRRAMGSVVVRGSVTSRTGDPDPSDNAWEEPTAVA
jgi:uncharacterized repeat protein (TIGR01451 family)